MLLGLWSGLLVGSSGVAWADAAADLAAGREALVAGDLEKALPLLTSAAQALPQSVEAQLALAECQAKLGNLDKALAAYRTLLKLSPNHELAKRIVASLTGQQTSVEERLAAARVLIEVGSFQPADGILAQLLAEPIDPAQRHAARLMLAEARLWGNNAAGALTEALRVIQESKDAAQTGPARVIAALVLASQGEAQFTQAAEQIRQAGELAAPWSHRAALVTALVELDGAADDAQAAARLSARVGAPLASLPEGAFRKTVFERFTAMLLNAARTALGRGDAEAAVAMVWPMVTRHPVPASDALLKPLDLAGGWLAGKSATPHRLAVAQVLSSVGKLRFDRDPAARRELVAHWMAAEVLRQTPDAAAVDALLRLAADLAALSRPAHDRKPGTILSPADAVQRAVLLQTVGRALKDEQRQQAIELAVAQVNRYRQPGDLETGAAQFSGENGAGLQNLPPGPPHFTLTLFLAQVSAELGEQAFQ
jgi:tetratricopeptide (TPR) repeat protein